MLDLLFYLLLQLGLLGGPSDKGPARQVGAPTGTTIEAEAAAKVGTPVKDVTVDTDVSIGGSGWDDKN
jgi:hypothetical protein